MKIKIFFLMIIFFISLLPGISYADAAISSVSGSFEHENDVVIIGGSFGSKAQAGPLTWDNFEDGICSADTPTAGVNWRNVQHLIIDTIHNRNNHSFYCGHHNFLSDGTAGFSTDSNIVSQKWFVQYWFYLDENWDWGTPENEIYHLQNIKIIRFGYSYSGENVVSSLHGNLEDNAFVYVEFINSIWQPRYDYMNFCKSNISKAKWHCFQFEFKDSNVRQKDGEYRVWFDGRLVCEYVGFLSREDNLDLKFVLQIGWYNSWDNNAEDMGDNDYYMDDIYVDTTWARVELGNNPVFENCTHREIQIPTAWSDTEITIQFNQGSFQDGDTAYLFVIDEDGNASPGYEITVGGTPDNDPPTVSGQNPAPGATNVAKHTYVSAHIKDSNKGVDSSSVKMYINGTEADITLSGDKYDYTVTTANEQNFDIGQNVDIRITAQDLNTPPNVMDDVTYNFTVKSNLCDIDLDGDVDTDDASAIKSQILGTSSPYSDADVNEDGITDTRDIQQVINSIS